MLKEMFAISMGYLKLWVGKSSSNVPFYALMHMVPRTAYDMSAAFGPSSCCLTRNVLGLYISPLEKSLECENTIKDMRK